MKLNQTALITGASSGIGAATAKLFATEGYDLILFGRNLKNLENIKSACIQINSNIQVQILSFDFLEIENHQTSIEKLLASFTSTPTVLVNNAGIFKTGYLNDTNMADWNILFQTNLLSHVKLTQIVWPYFIKNKTGSIVNISSTLGVKPTANTGAYSALKAAQINWTYSLAQEGAAYNIRANCICPGIVDTPIHDFHYLPEIEKKKKELIYSDLQLLKFIGQPENIAISISFLAGQKSNWTTGAVLNVDGGINIK